MTTFRKGHNARYILIRQPRDVVRKVPTPLPPIRARLSEALTHDLTVLQLLGRDGDRCYICQRELVQRDVHIEHIIPRILGGSDDLSNLALACRSCNYRKGTNLIAFRVKDRVPQLFFISR